MTTLELLILRFDDYYSEHFVKITLANSKSNKKKLPFTFVMYACVCLCTYVCLCGGEGVKCPGNFNESKAIAQCQNLIWVINGKGDI